MRARRLRIAVRPAIFVGAEGAGEQGFASWLQHLLTQKGSRVHLDVRALGGGDPLILVEAAIRRRDRAGSYQCSILMLDEDRLIGDRDRGERARQRAAAAHLRLVVQRPKQEGLLLRLFVGEEERVRIAAEVADAELRRHWPNYRKPVTAAMLRARFTIDDLRRAARHDEQLKQLLLLIGLL
jgi:hypothetical protein